MFPLPQLLGQLGGIADNHSAVELVFVRSVAALHFAITLRTSAWDLSEGHPKISQMPREVRSELRAVVRLDSLDCDWQPSSDFLDERRSRFDGVVRVDPEHAVAGGLIDRRKLVKPSAGEFQVLDVYLDQLARDTDLSAAPGPWPIAFQRDPRDPLPFKDAMDCGGGHIDLW